MTRMHTRSVMVCYGIMVMDYCYKQPRWINALFGFRCWFGLWIKF